MFRSRYRDIDLGRPVTVVEKLRPMQRLGFSEMLFLALQYPFDQKLKVKIFFFNF